MATDGMTTAQAAAALGVKPATLYAYVSRGLISREVLLRDGRRESRFPRDQVLALAAARTRPRAGAVSALVESQVSTLDAAGRLAFRGVDVADCAGWGFERTARHVLGGPPTAWPAEVTPPRAAAGSRSSDVLRQVVLDAAGRDPERDRVDGEHCIAVAWSALEHAVVALTGRRRGTVAHRLAGWWLPEATDEAVAAEVTRGLDVALAVMVDHELTASTLAARAAAGVRADPWMVLLAGLCVLSGAGHARASHAAGRMLRDWARGQEPGADPVPGFGHAVYLGPDPRAELILAEVEQVCPRVREQVEDLAVHMARRNGTYPNCDLALAALVRAAELPEDAGELIFSLARVPGLMAHAMEEYPHGLRLRMRALG